MADMWRRMLGALARGGAVGAIVVVLSGCGHSGQVASAGVEPSSSNYSAVPESEHRVITGKTDGSSPDLMGGPAAHECAAAQIVLGKKVYGPTGGPGGTVDSAVLFQQLRNGGSTCTFVMPSRLSATNAAGVTRMVRVHVMGSPRRKFPHGAIREIYLSVSWPFPQDNPPLPCANPVMHPRAISLPLGSSALHIQVRGLWREICAAPRTRLPTIYLLNRRSHSA